MKRFLSLVLGIVIVLGQIAAFADENDEKVAKIELEGNPTTGYEWIVADYDKTVVSVSDSEYEQTIKDENIVGAGGIFTFIVTGLKEGKTEINLYYARPWESKMPEVAVKYNVSVDKECRVTLEKQEDKTEPKSDKVTVSVDGKELEFDVEPIIQNDRVLVPFRKIAEALGARVGYDDETKTVWIRKRTDYVSIEIGSDELFINGDVVKLDVSAQIVKDRTLVPVRAISEAFGADVSWNDQLKAVTIASKQGDNYISDGYVEKEVKNGDGALLMNICCSYPVIENAENNEAISKMNTEFEKSAKEFVENSEKDLKESAQTDLDSGAFDISRGFSPYDIDREFKITYDRNGVISVFYSGYENLNGAHPSHFSLTEIYNAETGKKMGLSDIFATDEDTVYAKVTELFKAEMANDRERYFEEAEETLKTNIKSVKYYLTHDGVVFYFDEYIITPYAGGRPEVKLDYKENADMFKIEL